MGQEIWLYPEQSKVHLLKDYLSLIGEIDDHYHWIQGPDYNCLEFNCYFRWLDTKKYVENLKDIDEITENCYFQWLDTKKYEEDLKDIDEILEIGYNSHHHKHCWAKCIAFEINKRYKFLKAGWDSVGWSEQFWDREPFDLDIQLREETMKRSKDTEVINSFQEEIYDLICMKKLCCGLAEEMFLEADKKYSGTIPIQ